MNISLLSNSYVVRKLKTDDIIDMYNLCVNNTIYYEYCQPMVTIENLIYEFDAVPDNKSLEDKYYLGFYDNDKLIAIIDLIEKYPNEYTVFIGFFMVDVSVQNIGIGSQIIEDVSSYLGKIDYNYLRLAWIDGNSQAKNFWIKNKFIEEGLTKSSVGQIVMLAQRQLKE